MSRASNLAGFSTSIQSVAPNNLVVGVITASSFVGNITGNATGLTGTPNLNVGVVTATSFVGDVTGTASTASFATTSFGLSGSPNIAVGTIDATSLNASGVVTATTFSGNITGTAATFTGNVSIAGTLTYEDVTNVDSIGLVTARSGVRVNAGGLIVTSGVSTFSTLIPDETRFVSVSEKLTRVNGNTVNLVYNSSGSNIGLATNSSGNITLSVTGIPTSSDFDNHTLTFSVFVNQTGTARSCTAVTLNGLSATIRWAGGSLANAISGVTTTSGMDIYSFTGINTVGSASTTANYYVLGVVNGGYR